MSPPRLTSTPPPVAAAAAAAAWSAARALAVAPRSRLTPAPGRRSAPRRRCGSSASRRSRQSQRAFGRGCATRAPPRARAPAIQTQFKISVVAERDQGLSERRVDVAVGELGRAHAGRHRLAAAGPRPGSSRPRGAVQRRQLGVLTEPRARAIKGIHGLVDGVDRSGKPVTVGRHHHRRAPERRKAGGLDQDPPETGAGCGAGCGAGAAAWVCVCVCGAGAWAVWVCGLGRRLRRAAGGPQPQRPGARQGRHLRQRGRCPRVRLATTGWWSRESWPPACGPAARADHRRQGSGERAGTEDVRRRTRLTRFRSGVALALGDGSVGSRPWICRFVTFINLP